DNHVRGLRRKARNGAVTRAGDQARPAAGLAGRCAAPRCGTMLCLVYVNGGGLPEASMLLEQLPRLYTEFAGWYRLLTPPEEYAEEAACYQQALLAAISPPPV